MRCVAIGCVVAVTSIARADNPSPEAEPTVGRVALGLGESWLKGRRVKGPLHQLSLGVRITEGDWITATYADSRSLQTDYSLTDVEYFFDVSVMASRPVLCARPLCAVVGAGLGYQGLGLSTLNDLLIGPPEFYEDASSFYGVFRTALRLTYRHVWFESSLDVRIQRSDTAQGIRGTLVLGIAAYLVL